MMVLMMQKLVAGAPSIQLPSARSAQRSCNLEPRTPHPGRGVSKVSTSRH